MISDEILRIAQEKSIDRYCTILNLGSNIHGLHAERVGRTYSHTIQNLVTRAMFLLKSGVSDNNVTEHIRQMTTGNQIVDITTFDAQLRALKDVVIQNIPSYISDKSMLLNTPIGGSAFEVANASVEVADDKQDVVLIGRILLTHIEYIIIASLLLLKIDLFKHSPTGEDVIQSVVDFFRTLTTPEKTPVKPESASIFAEAVGVLFNHYGEERFLRMKEAHVIGLQLFIVAHEYGHIAYKHPDTFRARIHRTDPRLNDNKTWYNLRKIQEMQADIFAFDVLTSLSLNGVKLSQRAIINDLTIFALFIFITALLNENWDNEEYPEPPVRIMACATSKFGENWYKKPEYEDVKVMFGILQFLTPVIQSMK